MTHFSNITDNSRESSKSFLSKEGRQKGNKEERMRSQNGTESARREKCKGENLSPFTTFLIWGQLKMQSIKESSHCDWMLRVQAEVL